MYLPKRYSITDRKRLHDFIRANGFGILFSSTGPEHMASHLPFVIDENGGSDGLLLGHMARANDQWKHADGNQVLVVFHGPHAYISPTWYRDPETVPTWNYATVHVSGTLRVVPDQEAREGIIRRITDYYESFQPSPWKAEFTSEYGQQMIKRVMAFEIEIEKLQGKWKMGQNHPPYRRRRAIDVLKSSAGDNERNTAEMMEAEIESANGN